MKKLPNLAKKQIAGLVRVFLILAFAANSLASPLQVSTVQAAGTSCVTSSPASGAYTVTPCITGPADGATVSGAQTISATYTTTGANPGVAKLIFYFGGQYLITDYQNPYTFTLPSTKFVDGAYTLEVEALMKDGFTSQRASISVTLNNGITTPPVNTNTFTPTNGTTPAAGQPFTLVAAGDGADGATNSGNVTNLISSWNPNLFLYVGDVYEKGTATEFYNWYGQASTFYGRFKPITDPVVGNHEYENGVAPGYFDYWNNVPNYYSYDAAGWHFIALNSNCSLLQNCAAGQAQYNWLLNDLNTHNNACTIAYFHHPVYNVGPEGYATSMNDIWALMAQHGVDIVLTGHDHDYQRWVPLNGSGVPSSTGITEFVTGSGGHGIQQFITTDSRMAIGYDTSPYSFGALRLQLNQDGAGFQYINYQGIVLDSGAIPCSGAPTDVTAPSTPTNLTATAHSASQADLSWTGSLDNVGVAGYDIYRNGSLLTSIGMVTSYSDTNLTLGTTYTYQVKARDAAGNTSGFSNSASVTMPSVLFSDGFESGNFSAWTSNTAGITVQQQEVYAGAYAARAISTGSAASFASKALSTAQSDLYYSLRFKIISKSSSTSAYVQRFRAGSTGGTALAGVFISSTNRLGYRNDVTSTNNANPGPIVTLGVWHDVQTHLHVNGASGQIEIWYDGSPVSALSSTENFGTNLITRVYAGDSSTTDVYDIALDEAAFNTSLIDASDSQAPTTPTGLTANATAPNAVNLAWTASSDNVNVSGYDIYRNGSLAASIGAVTSYIDTPVSPNFTYHYQVQARDAAGNLSALSTSASVTTPQDTTPPTVTLTSPTNGLTVNGNVAISADATDNVDVDHVDFLVNGTVVGTVGEGGPYYLLWDSTTVADGTTAVITAQAVDTSANTTISSSRTVTVQNSGGDTLPPSLPGSFTATAAGATRADLSWTASTDNFAVTAYDIYRNGALLASVGAVTSYSDSSVVQGASYSYQVQARDAAGNVSGLTAASSVTIPAPLFTDGFETGDLSKWTNNGLTVQQQTVLEGAYAARGTSTGAAAVYAAKTLSSTQNDLYYTTWFKIFSQGATSAYVQRFRTSANGAILGVFVSSTGKLGYRNDVASATTTSTTSVSQGAWHQVQTHVKINGANGLVEVWLDGNPVSALSKTESLGTNPIGRVQLGDSQSSDVYDIAFDEAAFDTSLVKASSPIYTLIDSGPTGVVGATSASFGFSATVSGATFECSLDAAAFGACTSPQNYSGLSDGSHTFAVRASDAFSNVDQTPAARTWTVDTTGPTVTTTTPADNATDMALATSVNATFSEAMDPASITATSFSLVLQGDTTPLPATVSYNTGTNTATLQPAAALAYASTYVATIKGGAGGATDSIGTPLAADKIWSFTTVATDTTPPTVTLTAPVDGATVSGTVTLAADASDNVAVDHVDFLVNGAVVGTDASAPYSFDWNASTLPNGSATISAQAVDTSTNTGTSNTSTVTIANDVTPPSVPANLTANAISGSQVDLTWDAATDNVAVTGYDILRNGTPLATVGAVTSYSDKTVGPSTSYQYQVQARDAASNVSGFSAAVSATTSGVLFSDRFETGDLSRWTINNGLTVQQQQVYAGNYAARGTASGAVANAFEDLSAPQYDLYYDIHFKILSQDPTSSVYVLRFRKADTLSALGIFVSSTGKLGYRNDIAGLANTSTANVTLNAWHEVQAHIHIDSAGGQGLVETWLDGTQVQSQAEALGNAPITRLQLGDSTTGRTYDYAYDDVSAAPFYINPGDIQPPSAPTNLNANAISSTQVDLSWTASTDNVGVTGYNVYRNGAVIASVGAVTNYSDTTTAPSTSYQYTVAARDAAENISTVSAPASVTTPADSTPPVVSLTEPVNGARLGGTIALSATATDNIAVDHVDFLVNGTVVNTDSTSPYSFNWDSTSIADGSTTIAARAVDVSNNPATSTVTITVDNTPPDTTITANPAVLTNSASASFSFTATETGSTFACSLDGAVFSACTSPTSYSALADGAHTFQVRAIDAAGNTDAIPAAWTWTVDTTAPSVTSNTPADRASNVLPTTSITATFSEALNPATVTTANFFVKPKGGNTSPVAASVTYDPATFKATLQPNAALASQTTYNVTLNNGINGIKDLAGNSIGNNIGWSFTTGTADTTLPTVTLTAPSNGARVRGTVTLSANASDNVAVASVAFLVNGTVVNTDTTSPYSFGWDSTSTADGSVTIAARATDTSNLTATTANITVTVDNTAPDTTITSGPSGTVTSSSASFSFTATETATFACSLDGAAFSTCTSPTSYTGLANGSHTFQVRATDTAGNADATPASQPWTISALPDTTITAGPSGTVNSASASFSFTSTQIGSTFTCSLDGAAFSACTSPKAYTGLTNGAHNFQVVATFQGVTDPTPAARDWTVDTLAPDTTITSGPTGSVTSTSASFSFTATETATFACSLDGAAFGACTSPQSYSGLGTGTHTFQVRATDTAGNVDATPASQSWTIITAPDTTITAGPSGTVNSPSASFSFTATITGSTFTCSLDGAAFSACTSPKTYSGLTNGPHTFQVAATNQGSTDSTPASRTWTIDTIAPTGVAITSPANGAVVSGQVTITATANDNVGLASVNFYIDGAQVDSDISAPYSTTWNTNKLKSGTSHTLYVIAVDSAGNTTQSTTITVTIR
jgi:chitodextrinase